MISLPQTRDPAAAEEEARTTIDLRTIKARLLSQSNSVFRNEGDGPLFFHPDVEMIHALAPDRRLAGFGANGPSERTSPWIKMRRSLARSSRAESFVHTRSLGDFITTTSGFRFSVHTRTATRSPESSPTKNRFPGPVSTSSVPFRTILSRNV